MLRRISRKPKHIRARYAFWTAVGITAVIAIVWTISLQYRFANLTQSTDPETTGEYEDVTSEFWNEAQESFNTFFPADADEEDNEPPEESETPEGSGIENSRPAFQFNDNATESDDSETSGNATTTDQQTTPRSVRIQPTSSTQASTTDGTQ